MTCFSIKWAIIFIKRLVINELHHLLQTLPISYVILEPIEFTCLDLLCCLSIISFYLSKQQTFFASKEVDANPSFVLVLTASHHSVFKGTKKARAQFSITRHKVLWLQQALQLLGKTSLDDRLLILKTKNCYATNVLG